MTDAIHQLTTFPGLATGTDFFERAYATGAADWPTARVRFTPRQIDPGIAPSVNVPPATISICVAVSIALVDSAGQVIRVGPWALVADAAAHSWQAAGGDAFEPEPWLLAIVRADLPPVLVWAAGVTAAATVGLLAAAPPADPPVQP